MSPYLQRMALTPIERILLRATFPGLYPRPVPAPRPAPRSSPPGRTIGSKDSVPKGRVKEVAIAFLNGRYGSMSFPDIGTLEKVDGGSLRAAVWRQRNLKAPAKRSAAA